MRRAASKNYIVYVAPHTNAAAPASRHASRATRAIRQSTVSLTVDGRLGLALNKVCVGRRQRGAPTLADGRGQGETQNQGCSEHHRTK